MAIEVYQNGSAAFELKQTVDIEPPEGPRHDGHSSNTAAVPKRVDR